jgi:hypothetical protein
MKEERSEEKDEKNTDIEEGEIETRKKHDSIMKQEKGEMSKNEN